MQFHVPAPPPAFDVTNVTDPGNVGFDVTDGGNLVNASASVADRETVTITLEAAPSGAFQLRYAQNEPVAGCIGPGAQGFGAGARGNLRDSDDAPSLYGYPLYSSAVNFDAAVP